MKKYIDADELIAEIERRIKENEVLPHRYIRLDEDKQLLSFITSLQHEQLVNKDLGTLIACDIIEMTAKKAIDKPQDKEKEEELMTRKINYLRLLEENYVQHEQPECIYGRTLEEREKCCKFCSAICEARIEQEQPEFPTTDEEVERALASIPKVELPDKYKTPDWLFKQHEHPKVDFEKEEFVGVAESPLKTFPRVNDFECGGSYRH